MFDICAAITEHQLRKTGGAGKCTSGREICEGRQLKTPPQAGLVLGLVHYLDLIRVARHIIGRRGYGELPVTDWPEMAFGTGQFARCTCMPRGRPGGVRLNCWNEPVAAKQPI